MRMLTIRPYISDELLTLGKISIGIPKYLMALRGETSAE